MFAFLALVGCVRQDYSVSKESSFESLLNQSSQDKDLFALDSVSSIDSDNVSKYQRLDLDIVSLSQKINLFSKCYYYEDRGICDKILQGFKEECEDDLQGFACALVGISIVDNKSNLNTRDRVIALRYFIEGCKLKDSLSCMFLRKFYVSYGYEKEAQRLLDSITNICVKGGVFECFLLSNLYEGDPSFGDYREYIKEYRLMACNQDLAIACGYLDSLSLQKQDYKMYQKRACNLGMLAACDSSRELNELNMRSMHFRIFRVW
ncbi:sel1 repeat family protein [Helicobacter muridarum]|uniref:Sel1 repeat family protein n=1 Tax=Helicobacter muridarum TaxID=216 RepID=A0A4U8TM51_9HELI|nr:sel1 repeat family protein [Helicobacter muridarum]TLE01086.1 sel1 repeat family protein [Helicobacter muridarum]